VNAETTVVMTLKVQLCKPLHVQLLDTN